MTHAMQRRTVLAGSGLVVAGLAIAACSSDGAAEPSDSASTGTGGSDSGSGEDLGGSQVLLPVADVAVGGGVVVSSPPIVITQPTKGQINGFTAICSHQGCLVAKVEDNEIICPCHGSRFSAVDGSVINGPAEQGLATAAVSVEGTNVVLA